MLRLKVYSVKNRNRNQCKETRPFNDLIASFLLTSIIKKRKNNKTLQTNTESITIKRTIIPSFWWLPQSRTLLNVFLLFSFFAMHNAQCKWTMGKSDKKHHENCKDDHSAPEQWPIEKKTSTPKIHPNESVLLLYIDI